MAIPEQQHCLGVDWS